MTFRERHVQDDFRARATILRKGPYYEDFEVGQTFVHHWGRTITESDTVNFSLLYLCYNPIYFNRDYAMAHGHPDIVVNPQFLFNVVLGLSVEDCSENGGPFLGVYDLVYDRPIYPGTAVVAKSETLEKRVSSSNPGNGIVTWRTEGFDSDGNRLIGFRRSNLSILRQPGEPT
ncbi:MaoC family dehydratase [Sphingobium sp.]|uniref:MaoC family dehydratase n=1 Tax=Sphingobium sp. TaxID=1912891 RepID=UPI003B3ABE4D